MSGTSSETRTGTKNIVVISSKTLTGRRGTLLDRMTKSVNEDEKKRNHVAALCNSSVTLGCPMLHCILIGRRLILDGGRGPGGEAVGIGLSRGLRPKIGHPVVRTSDEEVRQMQIHEDDQVTIM